MPELQDFKSKYDDLLLATLILCPIVLLMDVIALILHNVCVCRKNPEGKIFLIPKLNTTNAS